MEKWASLTVLCLSLSGAGCDLVTRSTQPSSGSGSQAFAGTWASTSGGSPINPSACGDLQWQIAELTPTSVSGTFSATCAGGIRVTGSGAGTLTGTTLNWNATGTAAPPQGPSCPFTLNGTAVPESADSIRVHYSGTVCGVAVSGSEVLQKRS